MENLHWSGQGGGEFVLFVCLFAFTIQSCLSLISASSVLKKKLKDTRCGKLCFCHLQVWRDARQENLPQNFSSYFFDEVCQHFINVFKKDTASMLVC